MDNKNIINEEGEQSEMTQGDEVEIEVDLDDNEQVDDHEGDEDDIMLFIEYKYCTICHIEQPLRTKHCKICDHCVATHDHHCPWIGNCVGERNKFWFFWFLLF